MTDIPLLELVHIQLYIETICLFILGIKDLPDSIKECKSLRSIDISVNPFDRFPDAITHIVGLRELYINDAYIEYLPANFGRLSSLKTLELRENNMMTLPKSMSRLVNLQRLDIGNNDFTELVRSLSLQHILLVSLFVPIVYCIFAISLHIFL